MNSNVSDIAEPVGSKTVTNKPASSLVLSCAEVARVSPPRAATHSNQVPSPKSSEEKNKSSSPPGCSRVNAGHQTGQLSQAAGTMAITPSIFSPTRNSPTVNAPPVPNNDICLTAVPPRKATFVSRLAPETSVDSIKGCSRVNAGHQTGQLSQAAGTRAITPSIFSPTRNSPTVNLPPVPNNDICLTAVPPRKAIFLSRLAPETLVDNIKNFLATKVPSVNLKRVSIFKMALSQARAISSFKILVPTENSDMFLNSDMLLNKSLWPVGSLIKEFIPRDRPRNTKAIVLSPSKNELFLQAHYRPFIKMLNAKFENSFQFS
ncbi:uncharacterized protein ACN427_005676 [Glossina fuscipes fuscipes]